MTPASTPAAAAAAALQLQQQQQRRLQQQQCMLPKFKEEGSTTGAERAIGASALQDTMIQPACQSDPKLSKAKQCRYDPVNNRVGKLPLTERW